MLARKVKLRDGSRVDTVSEEVEPVTRDVADIRRRYGGARWRQLPGRRKNKREREAIARRDG